MSAHLSEQQFANLVDRAARGVASAAEGQALRDGFAALQKRIAELEAAQGLTASALLDLSATTPPLRGIHQRKRHGGCPCGSCHRPCFDPANTACPDHRGGCEPDDHIESPTVNGEVI